jgi:hypothetical protein
MTPNTPTDMTILARYPNYGITPDGSVYRITPAKRGRTYGIANMRVAPVIHPRGYQWCVQLTGPDRIRRREPIKRLMQETYGSETIS